ncbi:TerD family protein [Gordonia humi]|uniref:Stress response protein SCP2 n=1 Tax=Gordonia humi TaxID=686429 RepID=A0A840F1I6_9ACTN|nr:TerD family protein [Gordonia humi]MBB4134200.1 stress response protein SCP2 [Gordonia humi]
MSSLAKGQNAPLPVSDVVVAVEVAAPADLSALLVTDAGKVRSDADFVFFNQPTGPGVRLQDGRLHISTAQIPADITAIRAVITLDDASSSFGRSAPPIARVGDTAGTPLFEYVVDGLSSESVVIAAEVYQRNGQWKIRAVGQGYAGGFADLVRDHGVVVDDEPAAPAPVASPTPPAPPAPPVAPAAPTYAPPVPAYTPPSQPGYAPSQPGYGQPSPAYGQAPQQPMQQPPAAPEISLSKDRPVSLVKGQKVSLRKEGGVALTQIWMGLGWDPVQRQGKRGFFGGGGGSGSIDLDASVLMFSQGKCVETVYFGHLKSKDRSIIHSGDNLTGEGDGDDEVISVNLAAIPPHVDNLVFVVTSYRGQTFAEVQNAYCRLIDQTTNAELARYTLAGGMPFTGVTMAVVHRESGDWKMKAIGEGFNGKTANKAIPFVTPYLG